LLYAFEGYTLDTDRRELRRADALISVQPQVFDLLEYLIRERDRVVSKDDLLATVWNGRMVSDSTLASRINWARRAIGDDGENQRLIRTLPRKGFRFVGEACEQGPAPEKHTAGLLDAASGNGTMVSELWRSSRPYRGLAAMEEKDSDYFFGRDRETVEVLIGLATEPGRLPLLLGNSGVGKSSLAQAGVVTALKRRAWPEGAGAPRTWPHALEDSDRWCYFRLQPGAKPITALVEVFLETWQLDRTGTEWAERRADWVEKLITGNLTLRDIIDQTKQRYAELQRPEPAAFFLYIDQGEELYVRAEERQGRRFSELLASALGGTSLHGMMSLRADFFGELQKDETLYKVHQLINVPPLREPELCDVVSRPAELLSAHFETEHLAADIARRTAEESAKDACALPLLSYLLDDMWTKMVHRGDGVLRLSNESIELGGVLVDRANAFLAAHPNSEKELRRIFTLKLATVREGEEPTRRRALRSEFTEKEWSLVRDLSDHPNRLLLTAAPEGGEPYAEVAHEAIFKRWDKLRVWIASEREFLAWRSGLEAARRAWHATPEPSKDDALLMGLALAQAQNWIAQRFDDIPEADREFIVRSREAAQQRRRRVQALVGALGLAMVAGLIGWLNQDYLKQGWRQYATIRPYVLNQVRPHVLRTEAERALKPGDVFTECAANCPEMVVVPAGQFVMGSPADEAGHNKAEEPQHIVTFAKAFAVSKFELTFADWDACAAYGDCDPNVSDSGRGRSRQPVINVDWYDAQRYVAWLSRSTGKAYRLLSESEWEYAARGGTQSAHSWGQDVGKGNANCIGCGTEWDGKQAAPAGSFPPNPFGLHDMEGNVWEWVEDCLHADYHGAPDDGTAWTDADCQTHVARGGAWLGGPLAMRNANRIRTATPARGTAVGFRVARTIAP
jgi:formylglycine-generating enzyme required for sulfatase activity/DNA-binding winged helix-turn-helix (wHTH) protein